MTAELPQRAPGTELDAAIARGEFYRLGRDEVPRPFRHLPTTARVPNETLRHVLAELQRRLG